MASSQHVLISWIGGNDLKAIDGDQPGPIFSTLQSASFDAVVLLYAYQVDQVAPYLTWLADQAETQVIAHHEPLSSPVNFREIFLAARKHLSALKESGVQVSILLSPGTPAMQAVWILLGKTYFPATFYQSSLERGVEQVDIPFELSAEYVPAASELDSATLAKLAVSDAPINAAFDNIITQNHRMKTLKTQAQILAQRDVPVLIYGETGTGKELFARAIHNASPRAGKPFVAVNCGAIPSELVDSTLFGHKKGAFTGAVADRAGVFQQAHGGTLFLDEFGELTPDVQVRLLRVLQEGTLTPVGATQEQRVNVRVITATHRNLMEAVSRGEFREDLFYRIAVGVLHLPPLREREGDLSLLADQLLAALAEQDASLKHKKLSVEAKNIILRHPWRGNVRELQSTLLRAALWCQAEQIDADDIRQALFQMPEVETGLPQLDSNQSIDIQEVIGGVVVRYIREALACTGHNKTRAAQLLGLKNYQTLNNWMEKYGIN